VDVGISRRPISEIGENLLGRLLWKFHAPRGPLKWNQRAWTKREMMDRNLETLKSSCLRVGEDFWFGDLSATWGARASCSFGNRFRTIMTELDVSGQLGYLRKAYNIDKELTFFKSSLFT